MSRYKKKRKWHRHKLLRKRIVWVTGLRNKGLRVRACEGKIRRVPFPSPSPLPLPPWLKFRSFPFRKPAAQAKEKIVNVWNYQVRALLLRKYENLLNSKTRGWLPNNTGWKTGLVFDLRLHDLYILALCVHGESKPFSGCCLTRQYKPPLYLAWPIPSVNSDCGDGAKRWEQEKQREGRVGCSRLVSPFLWFFSLTLWLRDTQLSERLEPVWNK